MLLHKYLSLRKGNIGTDPWSHTLEIIRDDKLYLSKPSEFNDPYDCNLPIESKPENLKPFLLKNSSESQKISIEKMLEAVDQNSKDALLSAVGSQGMRELIYRDGFNRIGISSFCGPQEHKDILMWAHYADNHRGIAIKIDESTIVQSNLKLLHKINYVPYPAKYNILGTDFTEIIQAATTKFKDWEYEDEYRIVFPGGAGRYINLASNAIKAVTFGLRTPPEIKTEILEILKNKTPSRDVIINEISMSQTSFELEENRIG